MASDLRTFTPDEIGELLETDLVAGLREVADALERGDLEGRYVNHVVHGFDGKDRVAVRVIFQVRVGLQETRATQAELEEAC